MDSPFRRFVSRVAWEWDDEGSSWRSVDGTLLFVDISGFTALSEKLAARGRIGAEELTAVLGRVFGTMLDAVFARGGSLLKFGGDALLLLFDSEDHAMQAAAAAVEMRSALREAAKEPTSVGRISLRMSSGIATGPVDLFLVGGSHQELIVSGPTASTTTLMESDAEASEIVVSPRTAALLPSDFVGDAKGRGLLLRKRKIHHPFPPQDEDRDESENRHQLVPLGLREIIGSGMSDSEHRVATVGFIGFTGLDSTLARSGPDAAAESLHTLVSAVQEAVDLEEVTFLASDVAADGGKIILTSGVPVARGDDEGRILRAARQILDSEQSLNVRIGLNRGHVFSGAVGTADRATYTVMGDTVNLAARLMTAAPPGALYAHPSVLDRSSTLFRTKALEKFQVKGKTAAVEAYEVGHETGSRPPETTTDLVFTGRDEELARLLGVLGSPGSTVTITGDSGIGKTRLIAEAIAADPDIAIFTAQGEPARSESPYWAVRDSMRELLGVDIGPQPKMRARLEGAVSAFAPDLAPFLPLIGDVTQIVIEDTPETSDLDTRFRPTKTAEVLTDLLERLIPDRLVVIAEDAHWMDELSVGLVESLSSGAEQRPWSVIVTGRPGENGFEALGEVVALGPLSDAAVRAIAIAATEAAPLRPHELDSIVARAGGNPLFLGEILRVVRETGDTAELPDSLDAVVSAEIDTLAPLTRQLLRYAAVLGRSFPSIILNRLIEPEGIALDEATRGDLGRFLERAGERYRFRLSVVHSAAYHGLSFRRRRELHARAGAAIEELAGDDTDAASDILSYHFSNSGDHEKAWRYSRIAAARAKKAYANGEAASQYRIAIEAAGHVQSLPPGELADPMIQLGDALRIQGDPAAARHWYTRSLRTKGLAPAVAADLHWKRAAAWYEVGEFSNAKRSVTSGIKCVAGRQDRESKRELARLHAFGANVALATGHFKEALDTAELAEDVARPVGATYALVRAYDVMDRANYMLGNDVARKGNEAIRLLEEEGELLESVRIMNNMGAFAYFDGDWDQAAEWYSKSIEAAERSGWVGESGAANTRANLAELLISQRKYEEALPLIKESKRVITAAEALHALPFVQLQEARAALGQGNAELAVEILEPVFVGLIESGDTYEAPETAVHLAEALIQVGRPEDAIRQINLLELEAAGDAERVSIGIMRTRALAEVARGNLTQAEELLRLALQVAIQEGEPYEEALVREALADLAVRSGDVPSTDLIDRKKNLFAALGITG